MLLQLVFDYDKVWTQRALSLVERARSIRVQNTNNLVL